MERMARFEAMLRDANDDEIALLAHVFGNGESSQPARAASNEAKSLPPTKEPQPKKTRKRRTGGEIDAAVRDAVKSLRANVSVQTVFALMMEHGNNSTAKRPKSSIRAVFNRLIEDGQLKEVQASKGTKPAIYEYIGPE
jgi:hypothetical protein